MLHTESSPPHSCAIQVSLLPHRSGERINTERKIIMFQAHTEALIDWCFWVNSLEHLRPYACNLPSNGHLTTRFWVLSSNFFQELSLLGKKMLVLLSPSEGVHPAWQTQGRLCLQFVTWQCDFSNPWGNLARTNTHLYDFSLPQVLKTLALCWVSTYYLEIPWWLWA